MNHRATHASAITLGLVHIPVKVYVAAESSSAVSFNQLHGKCGTKLSQTMRCKACEVDVARADTVKGYFDAAQDRYITLTEAELDALETHAAPEIAIKEFVPAASVPPVYFERAYYLTPERRGGRGYRVLVEGLRRSDRVAIAKQTIRGREHLVMIAPVDEGLALYLLHYADEVRAFPTVAVDAPCSTEELELVERFIGEYGSETFDPAKYRDEHVVKVHALIMEKKSSGGAITPAIATPPADVLDLVDALRKSLARTA
jgi:DNA end-binding protein Ku